MIAGVRGATSRCSSSCPAPSRCRRSPRGRRAMGCSSAWPSCNGGITRRRRLHPAGRRGLGRRSAAAASSAGRSSATTTSASRTWWSRTAGPRRSSTSTSPRPSIGCGTSRSRSGTGCRCGTRRTWTSTGRTSTRSIGVARSSTAQELPAAERSRTVDALLAFFDRALEFVRSQAAAGHTGHQAQWTAGYEGQEPDDPTAGSPTTAKP